MGVGREIYREREREIETEREERDGARERFLAT